MVYPNSTISKQTSKGKNISSIIHCQTSPLRLKAALKQDDRSSRSSADYEEKYLESIAKDIRQEKFENIIKTVPGKQIDLDLEEGREEDLRSLNFEEGSIRELSFYSDSDKRSVDTVSNPVHKTDAYYRNINDRRLECLIPLLREYKNKEGNGQIRGSLEQIAQNVGIGVQTIGNIYEQFLKDPSLSKRRLAIEYSKRNRYIPVAMKNEMRSYYVQKVVENNCMLSIREMYKVLLKVPELRNITRPDPAITMPIVKKILKQLGYVKKEVSQGVVTSNSSGSLHSRYLYCRFYRTKQNSGHQFYFIGHTNFHSLMYRNRGWAHKHKTPEFSTYSQDKVVSLHAIISAQGIVSQGLKCGNFTANQMTTFLIDFLKSRVKGSRQAYIVMDSSMLKNNKEIDNLMNQYGRIFDVVYLPPFSPLISPLQNMFGRLKALLMGRKVNNSQQLCDMLREQLRRLGGSVVKRSFEDADALIDLAIKKYTI